MFFWKQGQWDGALYQGAYLFEISRGAVGHWNGDVIQFHLDRLPRLLPQQPDRHVDRRGMRHHQHLQLSLGLRHLCLIGDRVQNHLDSLVVVIIRLLSPGDCLQSHERTERLVDWEHVTLKGGQEAGDSVWVMEVLEEARFDAEESLAAGHVTDPRGGLDAAERRGAVDDVWNRDSDAERDSEVPTRRVIGHEQSPADHLRQHHATSRKARVPVEVLERPLDRKTRRHVQVERLVLALFVALLDPTGTAVIETFRMAHNHHDGWADVDVGGLTAMRR